jgi:hypothetical protein
MNKKAKILVLAIALAGPLLQTSSAATPGVALPSGSILKNVSLSWEGRKLIFHATFNQYGHEMPIYLQWHPAKGQGGIAEIDTIEQFGRDMPLEVTLISLEKNPAGQTIVYMGQPASNTPRLEGNDAVNLDGRIVMTDEDAGQTDEYKFSLSPSTAGTLPRLSASK